MITDPTRHNRKSAIAAGLACALATLPLSGLAPGDMVSIDAVAKAEFLKGEPPAKWVPGEVYVLECWATWCGPCIAAIPHIDALYDKYHEKGLNVIGMNVFEAGKEKPAKFVEKMGDGMSYPVAYVGNDGAFERDWLKPAGINSIPHAFVVKDGKLLAGIHPSALDEEFVEALIEGGERQDAAIARALRARDGQGEISELVGEAATELEAGNAGAAAAAIRKIEDIDAKAPGLDLLRLYLEVVRKDWAAVGQGLEAINDPQNSKMAASIIALTTDESPDAPTKEILERMESLFSSASGGGGEIYDQVTLARILWKLDKKDQAVSVAKEAVGMAEDERSKEVFRDFAGSFEKGEPQTLSALSKAIEKSKEDDK